MINKFEKPKEIPMGIPEKAETAIEMRLPAVEVKNEVVWENKDVQMPFSLKEGEPTKIGVFLTSSPEKSGIDMNIKVMDNHFRSALLGRVIFQDNEGRLYRDVDIKGAGPLQRDFFRKDIGAKDYIFVEKMAPQSAKENKRGETPWGFADWGKIEIDRDQSEFFLEKGLRTHRALAIIKLEEIVGPDGNKISINKAKKLGYIKTTTEPVLEVRAFGTKARITDANKDALADARKMVAQEFDKPVLEKDQSEYLNWFAETLAKQVAIIHNNDHWHGYLSEHNITLDCRVVDLDSVEKLPTNQSKIQKDIVRDLFDATSSLTALVLRFGIDMEKDPFRDSIMEKIFIKNYFENCNGQIRNEKGEILERFNKELEERRKAYA